ncbi:hypothetical protein CKM354_000509200 [Cercospora kikuchii]|uniref:Heterokaryon incompatibility domain-containing protein n=1 Tax=Cercospora kikuchii TaxID=84275 RepID=A0A9P3CFF4_9PEZI|nr:uncharacterized protein CKM354_000509200 [Cercospora kikuchii]GIZ41798.1 hypothetical protein CKM354_000509200 [Cercospora kikuchii]
MKKLLSRLRRKKAKPSSNGEHTGPPRPSPPPLQITTAPQLSTVIQDLVHTSLGGDASSLAPGVCDVCYNLDPANDPYCEVGMADLCLPENRDSLRSSTVSVHVHKIISSSQTCAYCKYIMRAISTFVPESTAPEEYATLYIMENMPMTIQVFENQVSQQEDYEPQASIELFLQAAGPSAKSAPWPSTMNAAASPRSFTSEERTGTLGYAKDRSTSTADDQIFHFLDQCITRCANEHEGCKSRAEHLPDRVLQIREDSIALIETEGQTGDYLALSYCWGGDQDLKLTKARRAELLQGVPLSSLPIMFQDVVTVAKRLRLHRIWIDALCIVQDDHQDWEIQATKMGEYYNNATLVLAAASVKSPQEQLLRPRPEYYNSVTLDQFDHHHRTTICARRDPWVFKGKGGNWNSPLLGRAWAYQERLLARRIVTFGEGAVKFECRKHSIIEGQLVGVEGLPQLGFMAPHPDDPEMWSLFEDWQQIVGGYSGLKATFETDKLIAFAGIASEFARATGWIPRFGLWEQHLLKQMTWKVPEGDLSARPTQAVAPTWSWASVNTQMNMFSSMFSSTSTSFKVIWDCVVAPASTSAKPEVLTIHGLLAPCALICREPYKTNGHSHRLQCEGYQWDTYMWPDAALTTAKAALPGYDMDATVRATAEEMHSGLQPFVGVCYCLLLAKTDSDNPTCIALVLGRSRQHDGMFERIGLTADTNLRFFSDCIKAKRVTVEIM